MVANIRRAFSNDILEMLKHEQLVEKIGGSLDMLACAVEGAGIDRRLLTKYYDDSILALEHLTYVKESDSVHFYITLYNPQKGPLLLKAFHGFVKRMVADPDKYKAFLLIPQVVGYRYEGTILETMKKLCLTAKVAHDNLNYEQFICEIERCQYMEELCII